MAVKKLCTFGGILGVLLLGSTAFGQAYLGDQTCGICHPDIFDSYMLTGHPWKVVATGGTNPPTIDNNGFTAFPHDVPLPELPDGTTWEDVNYIFGNFSSGHGYVVGTAGNIINFGTRGYGGCVKCHVTGYDPEGGPTNGITGSWMQEGVRCEECHGFGGDHVGSFAAIEPPGDARNSCVRCHYSGADVDNIDFHVDDYFSHTHHPQGEQVLASPHFRRGEIKCHYCHDVHKSTFFPEEGGQDRHCTACHDEAEHSLPPLMAWMDCEDCHMPEHSHIFKITTDPISAAENMHDMDEEGNGFLNKDEEGKSFLTLDQVCLGCHNGEGGRALTLEEAAEAAEGMHNYRELTLDLVVHNPAAGGHREQTFQTVTQADPLTVDLSLWPGGSDGVPADWFIIASTDWGWYYWDPLQGWQPGLFPSLVDFDVFEVAPPYNVFDGTLFPGYYTFWFGVFTVDGATAIDSSTVFVLP